jgi:diguanylate cyclase (GGDEF)-like protein
LLTLELGRRNLELKEASVRDALTGLHNRRFLFEWLEKQMPLARRNCQPLSVALIDLDHFKMVNDNAGHQTGDEVLRQAARWLEDALRKSDVVARYGGEEFMVVLPGTGVDQAKPVVERCLQTFREGTVPGWSAPVTFSAGLTAMSEKESIKELFQRADDLLYEAKSAGRNQVCIGEWQFESLA